MPEANPPTYSIVTTCKGRLDDLKQSLPRFAAQRDAEVIVVDYDCPQQCGDYVRQEFPDAKVVDVLDRPLFNLPDARNHGAAIARGQVLVFLDADVIVREDFLERIGFPAGEPVFGSFPGKESNSLRGSSIVRRADFEVLGGYDELLSGYEGEDLDLYMRLRLLGRRRIELDEDAVDRVIEQDLEERLRYRPPNLMLQFLRGQLYQLAKEMCMRSQGRSRIGLPQRKAIMANVDRQVGPLFRGEKDFELTMEFPDRYKRGLLGDWEFSTGISIRAKRKTTN